MEIKIQLYAKPILKMLHDLPKEVIPIATASALNKTAQSVQSIAVKKMAADIGIKPSVIRKNLAIEKANRSHLVAYLRVMKMRRLSLIEIDAKAKQTSVGVSYRGEGGQRKLIPHAFIAVMKSGHRGVFKRLGKTRLPLCELQGVSLAHVFLKPVIQELMQAQATDRWPDYLLHELKFECQRRGYLK